MTFVAVLFLKLFLKLQEVSPEDLTEEDFGVFFSFIPESPMEAVR